MDAAAHARPARAAATGAPVIEVDHVSLNFGGGVQALADTSLSIARQEFVSVIGPSGCGKTTLLNLLAGLVEQPYEGRINLLGQKPTLGNPSVSYMLARDCLLPWRTALENTCYGMEVRGVSRPEAERRARELLAQVGLSQFESAYPKALSHGMRQRVALARTFCLDSPLLLMDEPFGALDAQTKIMLHDTLMRLYENEKRTVVFITHDLAEAITLSDRVIVMTPRPGRIVREVDIDLPRPRSVRELQANPRFHELYAELWNTLDQAMHGAGH
ncbi:ABC transporter ATP-binding protein [Variovorax sp. J22R133]|uniref:ABC transporter ATP-binding protein n=1 Tax=Variovorax brevis TaxID=3053503 RepID=UPI002574F4F5|nr:ABC transporter ATP-binding protein [Variovorax sp. J22R133]MDM0117374.1 ABC transporter ATP-binding protein [Variovorax sp. J22R133]